MKFLKNHAGYFAVALLVMGTAQLALPSLAQTAKAAVTTLAEGPYKVVKTAQFMGAGRIDYVYADNKGRRLYVPRGNQVLVYDLDTLQPAGAIPNASAHGVAVDPKSDHGFCSSSPVVMWDTKTLATIKTIPVQGGPDGILFEPATERIYVFSHRSPNVTVINPKDGSIAGTIDLGGAPEQAASDGRGHLYVDLEDKDSIAVVDVHTLKTTAQYSLAGQGGGPGGLGLDVKNHILFVFCHDPATAVILNANNGKILATLPIGHGTDSGLFNPATMEAFSSQGDGTLTVIKEKNPVSFEVEQNVPTKPRAKTCTLDTKNNQIILIATAPSPVPPAAAASNAPVATPAPATTNAAPVVANPPWAGGGRRGGGPGPLYILVVGR